MALLKTEPVRWGSWSAAISSGDEKLTELTITFFRSRGRFELDGEDYTVIPNGFLSSRSELRKGPTLLARAEKPSFLRRRFTITSAGHRMELESRSWTGREYVLSLEGRETGWIRRHGFMGNRLEMDFPEEVPVFLQVYFAYLVLAQAKAEAAAAASS